MIKGLLKIMPLIFFLILVGCYKEAHSRYSSQNVSFQFDEPRKYCERYMSDTGLEMTCEEGMFLIGFVKLSDDSLSIETFLKEEYGLDEANLHSELEGKRARLSIYSSINNTEELNQSPTFISVIPMGNSRYAIAEGYPTDGYETEFEMIFKNLISTFEP